MSFIQHLTKCSLTHTHTHKHLPQWCHLAPCPLGHCLCWRGLCRKTLNVDTLGYMSFCIHLLNIMIYWGIKKHFWPKIYKGSARMWLAHYNDCIEAAMFNKLAYRCWQTAMQKLGHTPNLRDTFWGRDEARSSTPINLSMWKYSDTQTNWGFYFLWRSMSVRYGQQYFLLLIC